MADTRSNTFLHRFCTAFPHPSLIKKVNSVVQQYSSGFSGATDQLPHWALSSQCIQVIRYDNKKSFLGRGRETDQCKVKECKSVKWQYSQHPTSLGLSDGCCYQAKPFFKGFAYLKSRYLLYICTTLLYVRINFYR